MVFSTGQIHSWILLFMQAVPAEGPGWSAMRSAPPGAGLLPPALSFTLIYKTAVFISGISHIVLFSEKSPVPGSWAVHPVHVKAKTCGQKRCCTQRCPD